MTLKNVRRVLQAVKLFSSPKQPLTLAICIQDGSLHSKSLSFPCADVVLMLQGRAWSLDDFELRYSPIRDLSGTSLYRSSSQASLCVHVQSRVLWISMDFRYSTVLAKVASEKRTSQNSIVDNLSDLECLFGCIPNPKFRLSKPHLPLIIFKTYSYSLTVNSC